MEGIKPQTEESIKLLKEKKYHLLLLLIKLTEYLVGKLLKKMIYLNVFLHKKKMLKKHLEEDVFNIKMQIQMLGLNSVIFS